MPPVGFEPTIITGEWPQTLALDRMATGTGTSSMVPEGNTSGGMILTGKNQNAGSH